MHLGHVALNVPDVDASVAHAIRTLGLTETPTDLSGTRLLSSNARHHELQLIEADGCSLDHLGLEVEHDRLDGLHDRVTAAGYEVLSDGSPEVGLASAFRFRGPLGIVFEIYSGMTSLELTVQRQIGSHARGLGHVTFLLREKEELVTFLIEVLGFRVSDELGPFQWLRCDAVHHGIAAGSGFDGDRMHHYAFELEGWAGMLRYLDNLAVTQDSLLTGPGRHGPGFNLFTYTLDPAGVVLEAYADMLRIENEANYQPVDWSRVPNALSLWGGSEPDPAFFTHGAPIVAGDRAGL